MSARSLDWPLAAVRLLKFRWGEGATASQISRELCERFKTDRYTRDAVLGKKYRLGLLRNDRLWKAA
jgi:hypothetical protein